MKIQKHNAWQRKIARELFYLDTPEKASKLFADIFSGYKCDRQEVSRFVNSMIAGAKEAEANATSN